MSKLTLEDVKELQNKIKEKTGASNMFLIGHKDGLVFMKVVINEDTEAVYGWMPNHAREIAAMMLAAADEIDPANSPDSS